MTTAETIAGTRSYHCFQPIGKTKLELYTLSETIAGTRSYHCFQPNGKTKLELYTLSADEICFVKNLHASKGLFVDTDCLKVGHYVAAIYEGQWHPSLIFEINWD